MTSYTKAFTKFILTATPALITLAIVLSTAISLPFQYYEDILPWLGLIAIFYWTTHRPDLLPTWTVFILGLMEDIFTGTPFGLHALIYTLNCWIISSQRRFFIRTTFLMFWWGFGVLAIGSYLLKWGVLSLYNHSILNFWPVSLGIFSTICTFPLLVWVFMRIQKILLSTK